MATTRVFIYAPDGTDISNEIETRNGKSNPWGWSQHEVWWKRVEGGAQLPERIGYIESGGVYLTRGFNYCKVREME